MTVEQLQEFLKQYKLTPSKMLGQNFLLDDFVLQDTVDAADIKPGQAILEIGPGIGNLTKYLLEKADHVFSVEKDPRMLPILTELKAKHSNFNFVIDDILQFNFLAELEKYESYSVVANIPYYITGKIIRMLVEAKRKPSSLTLLVQKEVGRNLTAAVGDLNLLALSVQLEADAKFMFVVPARKFYPAPKVDSAVVRIEFLEQARYPDMDRKKLFRVMKSCFAGKRKQIHNTLTNNLKLPATQVKQILAECNIDQTARPQQLSLEDWVNLLTAIDKQN